MAEARFDGRTVPSIALVPDQTHSGKVLDDLCSTIDRSVIHDYDLRSAQSEFLKAGCGGLNAAHDFSNTALLVPGWNHY
jgi:hypothetical protein